MRNKKGRNIPPFFSAVLRSLCRCLSGCLCGRLSRSFLSCSVGILSSLDAQRDPSAVLVDLKDLCADFLSYLELVGDLAYSLVRDLGDVDESVKSRSDLYECAVFLDLNYLACDLLAYLVLLVDDAPGFMLRILTLMT